MVLPKLVCSPVLQFRRRVLDVLHVHDARRQTERQLPHAAVPPVLADVQRELLPASEHTAFATGLQERVLGSGLHAAVLPILADEQRKLRPATGKG